MTKLDIKFTCRVCGKDYGKTNLTYKGKEFWQTCACSNKDKIFCINPEKIKSDTIDFLDPIKEKQDD